MATGRSPLQPRPAFRGEFDHVAAAIPCAGRQSFARHTTIVHHRIRRSDVQNTDISIILGAVNNVESSMVFSAMEAPLHHNSLPADLDLSIVWATLCLAVLAGGEVLATDGAGLRFPAGIQVIVDHARPLVVERGDRLPLFLWPAHDAMVEDDDLQEQIVRELDARGVAAIASWKFNRKEETLQRSLRLARVQQKFGLMTCVNANACMYGFFDGSEKTAHINENGEKFFDSSIPGGRIGCPFRIDHRYPEMRRKIAYFANAYNQASLPIDFVFGDWEIDGPLEINQAWKTARRCRVCRQHIAHIDHFAAFQDAVRRTRADATKRCYVDPIQAHFPNAWIGNYGVYPCDGYRYWYDYFENFVEYHPHRVEHGATYRRWPNEFPWTGYTVGMPVVYPWSRIYDAYRFDNTDYRWFYNMLLVMSNAGKSNTPNVPLVPFVHWHVVFEDGNPDPSVRPMSRWAYRELLWHCLLRGADSFFMWCRQSEAGEEVALVHEVWSEALRHAHWLRHGTPTTFDVPSMPGEVVSGMRVGDQVLVRRTQFGAKSPGQVSLRIEPAR